MTYLVLDGPDGGGKSTQARLLSDWLREQGRAVLHLREPGSTPVGEALRQLLLAPETGELRPVTEALLFSAARAELVARVIRPALQQGSIVVSERCFASTLVYQGLALAGGLDFDWLIDLTRRVHGAVMPDAIFVLDVPAKVGSDRRRTRTDDRFERRGDAFQERVRESYLELQRRDPSAHVVDATRAVAAVQADLQARVARLLS